MKKSGIILTAALLALTAYFFTRPSEPKFITLASTTSTEDSGLLKHLTAIFKTKHNIEVKVIAVGTGQAFALAAKGDADALLTHDRKGEDDFVAKGNGIDRRDVMYNDFVFLGAKSSPLKGLKINEFLAEVVKTNTTFVSRGDDSGTHRKEVALWKAANITPKTNPNYKEVGAGMGASINTATAQNAVILTDRATWASFQNKQLEIVLEGDATLLNPYGSILVSPVKHPHVKKEAKIWHEWLTSAEGKRAILEFKVNGQQLFF